MEGESEKDPVEAYDAEHGKPEAGRDHEGNGLTEAGNKQPAEAVPFKITHQGD